jgi:hypothetical protein
LAKSLAYELDSLAVDVFELTDTGLTVESLTGGHGMTELAASSHCICWAAPEFILCSGSCPCSAFGPLDGEPVESGR